MGELKEIVFSACSTFVIVEIIYFITPKETSIRFLYGLIYTLLISLCVISAFNMDYGSFGVQAEFGSGEVKSMYLTETEKALCAKIEEALAAAGVGTDSVTAYISIDDNDEIEVEGITVKLKYITDYERGRAVLDGLFGDLPQVEVLCGDG